MRGFGIAKGLRRGSAGMTDIEDFETELEEEVALETEVTPEQRRT